MAINVDDLVKEFEEKLTNASMDESSNRSDLSREICLKLRSRLGVKYEVWTEPPLTRIVDSYTFYASRGRA